MAAGIKKLFDVASPVLTAASVNQTGDSYARLGAPAGASVSADVLQVKNYVDDIGAAGAGLSAIPWNAAWDAEVQSEVNDELVLQNLDHLLKTATAGVDMTGEVVDGSVISRIISNSDTSLFVPATSNLTTLGANVTAIDDYIDTEVAAILADTNELQTDWVNGGRLDLILDIIAADTTTDIPALIGTAQGNITSILADTGELQTDWVNGGRLDLILDIIAADTTTDIPALINDLPTNAELATALGTADDAVLAGWQRCRRATVT